MIRMIQSKSAAHAKAYFSDALSKSDYFVSDQELAGIWQGKLAERLGLSGETSRDAFFALCENFHPQTGEHLTPRTKEDRTTGYDINFHCPKSVSVLHAFSKDDHILDAFRESVTETMKAIEADSRTRVRLQGQYDERPADGLVWGQFVHQTARPVDGSLPDPHLHSHCFVFNATWDNTEQRVKAVQFREMKRDMPFYQAHFHKILSDKLADLGYAIRRTDKSFEIAGVPEKVLDLFSKRTDEIGRMAKEKGITDAKELDELGARTRAKKQKSASMEELKAEWFAQVKDIGDDGKGEGIVRFGGKEQPHLTAEQCIDHAKLQCIERASVMDDRRFLATAYRYSVGMKGASVADINSVFESDKEIIHVAEGARRMSTTKEVIREEEKMVALATQGIGMLRPLYETAPEIGLMGQQGEAIRHVLTTRNRVSIIRGAAGTGKTTLMKEAVEHIERAGKTVTVVAPTAEASRGVLKGEGFKDADTVAKIVITPEIQEKIKDQVLWVDEAGLLGTKDMTALLQIATKQNAQLILGGDTRQHSSVVRGDALRVLNVVGGIKCAEVNRIFRQEEKAYRDAVGDLSKGNIASGFAKLDDLGFIKEAESGLPQVLVEDYIEVVKAGKTALVISPTHAQADAVTEAIRTRLQEEKIIGKRETDVNRLKNLNLTVAEKSDARNFETGQFVQFGQHVTGFPRGSLWQVERNGDKVMLTDSEGTTHPLPTKYSQRYDVFEQRTISLAKGDKVVITRNGFDLDGKRLDNGDNLQVVSIKNDRIKLQNVRSNTAHLLDMDFGHIAYGHCVTSYASQGKTTQHVFIYQPAETFPATDAKQFYVSVSRAKERAHIYTNDKQELLEHAQDTGERMSALELVRHRDRSKHLTYDYEPKPIFKDGREHEPD